MKNDNPETTIGREYWERISPYVEEIPHLSMVTHIAYEQAKDSPDFDLRLFSDEVKEFAFVHAKFIIQTTENPSPNNPFPIELLGLNIEKISQLVKHDQTRIERRDNQENLTSSTLPVGELVADSGIGIQQLNTLLEKANILKFDPDILKKLPQKTSEAIQGGRVSFYNSKLGHDVTHWLVAIFGVIDLASDVFPNAENLISAIRERSVAGYEPAIGLGIIRAIIELVAVDQITNAYKEFKNGNIKKGALHTGTALVASIISISSFLTTKYFVLNSQPPHWMEANGPFLFNLSTFLLAFTINYGAEINLLLKNISRIDQKK